MEITTKKSIESIARTIRGLSIDGVQAANSGHPGLPLGCADLGALLYSSILKHDPADSGWADRDRFVLSAGHGSMLLYSLLHLFGYGLPIEDLKRFRQLGSLCPGHPEFGLTNGVEMTTGPLGAGFATAVGIALAETVNASRFNTSAHKVVDHFTYVLAGDGCLMEGVSSEAASLAGHLGLGKLIVFYDSNHITIEGGTDLAFSESVAKRFEAYNWQVQLSDGYDLETIEAAVLRAQSETGKPSLIILNTTIGKGSPNRAGTHEIHGTPLGPDEVKATKLAIGLDPEKFFQVSDADYAFTANVAKAGAKAHEAWDSVFASWAKANPEKKKEWDISYGTRHADIAWPKFEVGSKLATRAASGQCLQAIAAAMPWVIGGSADLAPSNNTNLKGLGDYQKENRAGRNLHFGVREHAMGSAINGITLHGGLTAYGATFMVFADYMRPTIRLAAIMRIPSIFVFTHDSFQVGEDGPTHQPVEQLASLRIIPGLEVLRPADSEETALAWELALKKRSGHHTRANVGDRVATGIEFDPENGPSVLALTRQNLSVFAKPEGWKADVAHFGAYVVRAQKNPDVILLATGSEVGILLNAAELLTNKGKRVQVLSVPSLERFRKARKDGTLPSSFLPAKAVLYVVEAGHYLSWAGFVDEEHFIGLSRFGESGKAEELAVYFGITPDAVVELVEKN